MWLLVWVFKGALLQARHRDPHLSRKVRLFSNVLPVLKLYLYYNHCFRHDEKDIDQLTCTDIKQVWGTLKEKTLSQYEPTPLKDFCHIGSQQTAYKRPILNPSPEMEAEFRAMYLAGSALLL